MGKKRGQGVISLSFYLLLELALIAMFIAAVFVKINAASKDQTYYQRFVARDSALLSEAILAAEGDFKYNYAYSTPKESNLDYYLKPDRITVALADERGKYGDKGIDFLTGGNSFTRIINSTSKAPGDPTTFYQNPTEKDFIYARNFTILKSNKTLMIGTEKTPE